MSKHFSHWGNIVNHVFLPVYVLWLLVILILAWGTMPFMKLHFFVVPPPPEWLSSFAKLIFYRDYIF